MPHFQLPYMDDYLARITRHDLKSSENIVYAFQMLNGEPASREIS